MVTMTSPATLQDQISEEIRVVLVRRRMTARQLAEMLGWGESTLSRKLAGHSGLSVTDLERIARALNLPAADLLPRGVIIRDWGTRKAPKWLRAA